MDPAELMRAIRRRWPIVAITVAAALLAGWLTTRVVPAGPLQSNYKATHVLLSTSSDPYAPGTSNLKTMAALATVGEVPTRVAEVTGLGEPTDLVQKVQATGNQETGILKVSATSADPDEAVTLANTFANELVAFINQRGTVTTSREAESIQHQLDKLEEQIAGFQRQIGEEAETDEATIVAQRDAAIRRYGLLYDRYSQLSVQTTDPTRLQSIQDAVAVPVQTGGLIQVRSLPSRLLLAGFLGLLAGIGLVYVWERLDTRIHTKESAEQYFDLPVLAEIPYVRGWRRRSSIAVISNPKSPVADSFRLLAAGIVRRPPTPPQAILVTGPGPGEGKSTVVANLAAAFAEVGKKVLILSCDLHRPTIHLMFGVPNSRGLTDALKSKRDSNAIVNGQGWRTPLPSVRLVPSGIVPEKPGELLSSPLMQQVIAEARGVADIVLIDTAPILAASDATHLFPLVDAVLVVGRAGRTTALSAQRSSELLLRLGAPVVGAALNGSTEATLPRGYYGYYADRERRVGGRKSRRRVSTMAGLTGDEDRA
jgi:capsular exopolysaccharide synthesis family protein